MFENNCRKIDIEDATNPDHYKRNFFESIDEMVMLFGVEHVIGFCKCNAWKYRSRAKYKNGSEDLKKSDWYLEKLFQLQETDTRWEKTRREQAVYANKLKYVTDSETMSH